MVFIIQGEKKYSLKTFTSKDEDKISRVSQEDKNSVRSYWQGLQ